MSAPGTFQSCRLAEMPIILRGEQGQEWAAVLGAKQDAELPLLRVAALSRLPTRCPDDALDGVGAWLNIPRFYNEPDGTTTSGYRGRLCAAWKTWKKAGSARAIIESLEAYGFADVVVYTTTEQTTPDGETIPAYPQNDCYADFWVLLGPDFGTVTPPDVQTWGDFVWGGETVWGTTAALSMLNAVRGQVLKWKAAHAHPIRVIFWLDDGMVWGPGIWGVDTWGGHAFGLGF
jgi:hypothetical protein